jgi:high-affinity K+ transport system ATPase subunit B
MAQQALAECGQQDSLLAGFTGRLTTAERLLATVKSQRDEMQQHRAFVASVEQSLFNPQGDLGTLKLQVKALQARYDSEGSIECHGVHFLSKTEMAAWFKKNRLTIGIFCDAVGLLHTIHVERNVQSPG